MPSYMMSCTHCSYEVLFRTEVDAKTEGVRHLGEFPTHGVKVTPSEDALIRRRKELPGKYGEQIELRPEESNQYSQPLYPDVI